jgi:hypothetical protein
MQDLLLLELSFYSISAHQNPHKRSLYRTTRGIMSYLRTEEKEEMVGEEVEQISPKKMDVILGDERHPGTKKWRKSITTAAVKNPEEPPSPPIFRRVKKNFGECPPSVNTLIVLFDLLLRVAIFDCRSHNTFVFSSDGRRFFVQDPDSGLHEAKKSDIIKHFKGAFEEEKSKLILASSSDEEEEEEEVEEVERVAIEDINEDINEGNEDTPSSKRHSSSKKRKSKKVSVTTTTITIGLDGSRTVNTIVGPKGGAAAALNNAATSGDSNSTRKQGGSDETMLKTVTMYFPSSESGEQPSISEKTTPLSMCSQDVVAAVAVPSGNNGTFMLQSSSTSRSPSSTVHVPEYSKLNGSVYGRSIFQVPNSHNRLVTEADHEEFAPNKCICCTQCVGDQTRARTYARVYENRMETNYPYSPWCCFTPEYCIVDNVTVYYFDKGPSQQLCGGHYVECDCLGPLCGPPVVFVNVPRCCCNTVDLRPCFGETLFAAPCDCYGLRCCICIGRPCYQKCACPLAGPIKNGSLFLERYRGAVDDYAKIRPVKRHTVFNRVSEKPCGFMCDKVTTMTAYPLDVSLLHCTDRLKLIPGAIPKALIMDRI